jgi:penicillin-binding protein 1A
VWRVAAFTASIATELYLNTVYFGEGYYGVEAASRGYFGKSAADLSLADAALLAALVRSPSVDAPCVSRVRATRRRNLASAANYGRICEVLMGWLPEWVL